MTFIKITGKIFSIAGFTFAKVSGLNSEKKNIIPKREKIITIDMSKRELVPLEVLIKTRARLVEKQVVKGVIVAVTEKDVVINIGFKSDGLVSRQEFNLFC